MKDTKRSLDDRRTVKMSDVCTLHYGKALTASVRRLGSVPVYGSNGPTGWHDVPLRTGPTVIIGRKGQGPLGVEWVDGPFWVIDTAYYTTFKDGVDPKFFYYFTDMMGLNHLKDGTSNPSLTREVFGIQDFPLPPLDQQLEISSLLSLLDDKINLNRKAAETLEEMALAVYRSWFVDFDPVVAKSEGRKPAFMTDDVAALFPSEMGPDGIPAGWNIGKLIGPSLCSFAKPLSKVPAQDLYAYLPTANIHHSHISDFEEHTASDLPSRARMTWKDGRVFVARMKDSPKHFQTLRAHQAFWNEKLFSTGFVGLDPAPGYGAWLYSYIQSQEFEDQKNALVSGAVMQALNNESIKSIDVVIPPPDVTAAYEDQVKLWRQKAFDLYLENLTLAELRDTLLPKLMSGEIRVGGTETESQR